MTRPLPSPSWAGNEGFFSSVSATVSSSSRREGLSEPSGGLVAKKLRRVGTETSVVRREDSSVPIIQLDSRPTKSVPTKAAAVAVREPEMRRKLRSSSIIEERAESSPSEVPSPSIRPFENDSGLSRRRVMRMTTPVPSSPPPAAVGPSNPIIALSRQSTALTDYESETSEIDATPRRKSTRSSSLTDDDSLAGYVTPPRRPQPAAPMDESPTSVTDTRFTGISPLIKLLRVGQIGSESPPTTRILKPQFDEQSQPDDI